MGCINFAGGYPSNLHEEINNFSIIAGGLSPAGYHRPRFHAQGRTADKSFPGHNFRQ